MYEHWNVKNVFKASLKPRHDFLVTLTFNSFKVVYRHDDNNEKVPCLSVQFKFRKYQVWTKPRQLQAVSCGRRCRSLFKSRPVRLPPPATRCLVAKSKDLISLKNGTYSIPIDIVIKKSYIAKKTYHTKQFNWTLTGNFSRFTYFFYIYGRL